MVVVIGGLALFFGLALLVLRRQSEVLQEFLTPPDADLEEEFFRARTPPQPEEENDDTDDTGQETNTNETAAEVHGNAES